MLLKIMGWVKSAYLACFQIGAGKRQTKIVVDSKNIRNYGPLSYNIISIKFLFN